MNTGGLNAKRDLPGGRRMACIGPTLLFIRNRTRGPPDDILMVLRVNEALGGRPASRAVQLEAGCSHGLCIVVDDRASSHQKPDGVETARVRILVSNTKANRPGLGGSKCL